VEESNSDQHSTVESANDSAANVTATEATAVVPEIHHDKGIVDEQQSSTVMKNHNVYVHIIVSFYKSSCKK
jgi:hypothetical protein